MRTTFWSKYLKRKELGRPRRQWEDNITMDIIKETVIMCGVDSSSSRLTPISGSCEHSIESSDTIKEGELPD
jgi:hypothetical protein